MIVDQRFVTYMNSLDQGNTKLLNQIENEAQDTYVPIIRREMQSLLKVLLAIKQPTKILEVGTAIGFSSILLSEYGPDGCVVTTIEKYEKRIPIAKENFKRARKENSIILLEGDAIEILQELDDTFDFVFMDAAKGQYLNFFPEIMRLLSPGGVLVSDNIMQDGDIIQSRYAVTRRNRTIHSRMRDYLYELTHNEKLTTTVLPIGDGVTISTKVREAQ